MQNLGLIAKSGYKYILIFGILFLISLAVGALECLFFAILIITIFLFRDFKRSVGSHDEYAILSPIDGKVKSVGKISYLGTDCIEVVVSKSFLGMGTLRAPCDMRLAEFRRRHGLFLCNAIKSANSLNERALYVCENGANRLAIRIIGGAMSRNLYADKFENINAGDKFGFMSDGRVVLILPADTRVSATVGDSLRASSSVIGFFNVGGKK